MKPTIDYIKRKFDEYNQLCFEGKLKPLPFKLSNARSFLGQVQCMRDKNPDGTWHYYDFVFRINSKLDLPENVVEDTILHEMIHYWIFSNQMQDTGPHGEIFIKKMKEINVKFNRNLSVVHQATKQEQDKDTEVRQHLICVSRLRNGRRGITIASKSRIFQLWDEMSKFPGMAECRWVVSTDPYFNRFPRATTAKFYPVHTDELEAHLQGAQELERKGSTIVIMKG